MLKIANQLYNKLKKLAYRGIPVVRPEIKEILAHDVKAFTQGLLYRDGVLFESTGLIGESSLRKLNPGAGDVLAIKQLPDHWGEGIASQGDCIVQLTWQSGKAVIYDSSSLEVTGEFSYSGEGWGLASLRNGFVMTNGTEQLLFRSQDFALLTTKKVRINGLPLRWLNDITVAKEHIYANRLGDQNIYEICSKTARVKRIVDCSELLAIAAPTGEEDVLNGIAFDHQSSDFYLTGKRWPYLFRVAIPAGT